MKAPWFPLAGLAIALTLSGCGGPPSKDDAETALAALLRAEQARSPTSKSSSCPGA